MILCGETWVLMTNSKEFKSECGQFMHQFILSFRNYAQE